MKQLTCEMCGSTDLIKQDGVFVCQSCGTKYSVEEAKKMMVEGTVHVDSGHLTGNYLSMAKNALDAGNNTEAENYCNKIIEVEPTSYEAWFIKGKAVGWASTLGNPRITETINAFTNALDNCPEEEKEALSDQCKEEIENLHKAWLTVRMENFMNHPNQYDIAGLSGDVQGILANTVTFLAKSGIATDTFGKDLGSIILNAVVGGYQRILSEYNGSEGKPNEYEFARFIEETDYCIQALELAVTLFGTADTDDLELYDWRATAYDAMIKYNTLVRDGCSWDYNFNDWGGKNYYMDKALTDAAKNVRNNNNSKWQKEAQRWRNKKKSKQDAIAKKEKEAAKKRFDEYWESHAEEKHRLETEKSELEKERQSLEEEMRKEIREIKKEKDTVTGKEEVEALDGVIEKLTQEKASLGIFKGKEKQAIQEKINQTLSMRNDLQAEINEKYDAIDKRISEVENKYKKKKQPIKSKIDNIKHELTKSR